MNTNGMIRDIEYLGSNGAGTWINLLNTTLVSLQKTASDSIEFNFTGYMKRAYEWQSLIAIYTNNKNGWFFRIAEYPELRYWYNNTQSYDYVNKVCKYTVFYGKNGEGSKLLVNDELVFESSSSPTFNGLHTTYQGSGIFSQNGGSFVAKGSYFYGLVCKKNGIKVIDLVPVRVGQVGYAYDKVTKTLYPSSGTGSFVLGPDVAKPVIGLYGMRKFYSTTDYMQDGLVAMWDGINNTGHGHDPEATVWKDLVGERDFTLNGAVVGGNSISWNGNYKSTSSHQPPAFVQMEIVFKTLRGYNWKVWFGDYGHSIQTYVSATIVSKTANTDNSSYRFYVRAVSIPLVDPGDNKKWATEIYENSVKKNISKGNFNYTGSDFTANTMQIGGGSGLSLHNVRLYSRYLSTEEVAANYAIDKARFNLP